MPKKPQQNTSFQKNLPNVLTLFRVLALPFVVYFLQKESSLLRFIAFLTFVLAAISDFVDGYLARRWQIESEFGKFMDPLADKFLVVGSFITLMYYDAQISFWMVAVIILRDIMITGLRILAIKNGSSMRTSWTGKVKTGFQMGAIITILLLYTIVSNEDRNSINNIYISSGAGISTVAAAQFLELVTFFQTEYFDFYRFVYLVTSFLPYFGMMLTLIITVYSGLMYLAENKKLLTIAALKKLF